MALQGLREQVAEQAALQEKSAKAKLVAVKAPKAGGKAGGRKKKGAAAASKAKAAEPEPAVQAAPINYLTAQAPPPTRPARKLCMSCGSVAKYKCPETGFVYATPKCLETLQNA